MIEEAPLSPEEAMEKWVETRKEVEGKRSGLRGRKKLEVRMLPKKTGGSNEKVETESVEEEKRGFKEDQDKKPERVTSKGIPLVMIDDDDDD